MDPNKLPGSLKIAILIQSMGKVRAERFLEGLDVEEVRLIKSHLSQMGTIPPDVVEKVASEFTSLGRSETGKDGVDDRNEEDQDMDNGQTSLETIQSLEPSLLFDLIKDEHPQTIAIILVHLKTDVAGYILSMFHEEISMDVAFRIANMDKVISTMVNDIDAIFKDVLKNEQSSTTHKIGGVDFIAEVLNQLDAVTSELIMAEIEEEDTDLADKIKQRMFIFDDIVKVDDKGLQKVLRGVESQQLVVALKAATEEVKEAIYRNMSSRASEMLKEEMASSGAVRMNEVEAAQQTIIKIIQEMEKKGEVTIEGKGDAFIA